MKAKLGNYVKVVGHHATGRVYRKKFCFSEVNENETWLQAQIHIEDKEKARNEPWYCLLMDNGGSIAVPESNIIDILDGDVNFKNPWESFYF